MVVGCERDMVCCNCKRTSAAWHLAGAELAQRGGGGRLVQLRFLVLHLLALRLPLLLLLPARHNSVYVAHTRMSSLCGAKQRDFAVAQRAALCWSCSQVRAVILSLTVDRLVMMMRLLGMMFRCAQAAAARGLVILHQAQAGTDRVPDPSSILPRSHIPSHAIAGHVVSAAAARSSGASDTAAPQWLWRRAEHRRCCSQISSDAVEVLSTQCTVAQEPCNRIALQQAALAGSHR